MNPCETAAAVTAIACAVAKGKDSQDLSMLGAVFAQLGDTLTTMATQMQICEDNNKNSDNNSVTDTTSGNTITISFN